MKRSRFISAMVLLLLAGTPALVAHADDTASSSVSVSSEPSSSNISSSSISSSSSSSSSSSEPVTNKKVSKSIQTLTKTRTIKVKKPSKTTTVKQKALLHRNVTTTRTYTDGKLTSVNKTYGKWTKGKWNAYKVPTVKNYTASQKKIAAKTVTHSTNDTKITVTYASKLSKPKNAPYYDPADMRKRSGQYYFKSSETKKKYPNLSHYKNVWLRVSILGNRVYVMSGKKVIYTMYSSAGRFENAESDTPRGTFHLKSAYGPSFMSSDGVGARYYMAYHGSDYLIHSVPINNYGSGISHNGYHYGYGGVGSTEHLTVLGTKPDSSGCIRLSLSDARWLYGQRTSGKLKVGTKIVIKYR